jgi:hypothetical protein
MVFNEESASNVTVVKLLQPWNVLDSMVVTSGGMDIEVNAVQLENAVSPMVFNEESASNVTVVKLLQL